jgi:hypothetical protein
MPTLKRCNLYILLAPPRFLFPFGGVEEGAEPPLEKTFVGGLVWDEKPTFAKVGGI